MAQEVNTIMNKSRNPVSLLFSKFILNQWNDKIIKDTISTRMLLLELQYIRKVVFVNAHSRNEKGKNSNASH